MPAPICLSGLTFHHPLPFVWEWTGEPGIRIIFLGPEGPPATRYAVSAKGISAFSYFPSAAAAASFIRAALVQHGVI